MHSIAPSGCNSIPNYLWESSTGLNGPDSWVEMRAPLSQRGLTASLDEFISLVIGLMMHVEPLFSFNVFTYCCDAFDLLR